MDEPGKTKVQLIEELDELRKTVAELKVSENSLREEAARWRELIRHSMDGIVVLEPDLSVYEANQKFADMIGYSLEETFNLHCWDWDKNFSPETILELARTVDEKGHHFETVHTRRDGSVYDVELCNNGAVWGGKKLILCVCRDITERKRGEAQLRESKELLSTFLDNFNGIAYQVSKQDVIPFTPKLFRGAVEQITGYTNEEFSNSKKWNDIIHPDDFANVQEARRWFADLSEYVFESEYRIIRSDGSVRWIADSARIVSIGGRSLIHGMIFDVTERKSAEAANLELEERIRHSQKLEAIGTLAGGVAHDFNNVLGIIMGYTDLALGETSPGTKIHDKLVHIWKASTRAKDIIRQLLTFSRKVGPKKQPVNAVPVVEEVLTFLRSTLPSTITINVRSSKEKIMINADPTQIHQVIMNLCVNASQSMENRSGVISVFVEAVDYKGNTPGPFKGLPDGKYLKVTISDNGCGIREDIIERIFDPYFTTRETGKGSGMGLAVVHGIIENHCGEIVVSSKPGLGATFTFMIPIIRQPADEDSPQVCAPATGTESVLFVDDEEGIATVAKLMLEMQGFRVKAITNPLEALELFRKNPDSFDIIVTDMTMPYINGDILFKEIRRVRQNIPVVLCTGHNTHIDEHKAAEIGLSAFVMKPISKKELTGTIRRVLDAARPSETDPPPRPEGNAA